MKSGRSGFTLIELLVVISIISLLASVVLASLSSARLKAKDVAIRQAMWQMRNVYQTNFAEYGDYSRFVVSFPPPSGTGCSANSGGTNNNSFFCSLSSTNCNNIFSVTMPTPSLDAENICKNIAAIFGGSVPTNGFAVGIPLNLPQEMKNYYSLMVYLPAQNKCLCIGSSGVSETTGSCGQTHLTYTPGDPIGCFSNP